MHTIRRGILSVLLGVAAMEPCQALSKTEWQTAGATMVGTFGGLHPAGELWAPTFQDLPAKAVLQVPPFPLNQNISATDGDAAVVNFYEIWRHLPLGLRNSLQRLGAVEERGAVLKFLSPLKIAYTFYSTSSPSKRLVFSAVDPKLSKPYLLACQSGENIAYVQCVCPFDEDGSALHCRRFPGGYLLRSKVGNVANDPFYAFDITGELSLTSTLSFLFISPDPRTKALSFSLFIPIFVDSAIALDARTLDYLCQRATYSQASGYDEAGIKDPLAFHRKVFPDLFPSLSYNPDLAKMFNACCFGSLLDLEVLLSILRNLPTSRLFIADKNMRSRCGSLRVTLTEEGVVPLIDVGALRRENGRLDRRTLDIVIQNTEAYNLFAKALWQHVRSVIVTNGEAPQELYSINDAGDEFNLGLLGEDVPAEKRLLEAVASLNKPEFKCTEWKILSASEHAFKPDYFGPRLFILPETDLAISPENRVRADRFIAFLYQYAYDRIASMPPADAGRFLERVRDISDVPYRKVVDLGRLENYFLAEDTQDGKFSCDAVVPGEFKSLSGLEVKTHFAKALLSGLRVLFSPLENGVLKPIAMQIPDVIYNSFWPDYSVLGSIRQIIATYFRANYAADERLTQSRPPKQPAHYVYTLFSMDPTKTGDEWSGSCGAWLRSIGQDTFPEAGSASVPGIFFNPAIACYIISRIQTLADACLTQRNLAQIQDKMECILGVFQIISQRFDFTCGTGKFEGMLLLFTLLANGDPSTAALPVQRMMDVLMKITVESRFANVFSSTRTVSMDPHWKMSFREALKGMYGLDGKEMSGLIIAPRVEFGFMLQAAQAHGVNTSSIRYYQELYPYPITPAATDACRRLMRLVMTPEAVIDALSEDALCRYVLEKFLREKRHLTDEQISILLRNPSMKRQIMADALAECGYLKSKS